jgi:heparosan-N-sulfate-glucuronate 5-epimerase
VDAGFFSSSRRLRLWPGRHVDRSRLRGYYIDFRPKTLSEHGWPPAWLQPGMSFVPLAQLGLGYFETFVADGDEASLDLARRACEHFVATQLKADGDPHDGGWRHTYPFTYRVELGAPWLSAMAQGQAASLLLRVFGETGEEELAATALRAIGPFRRTVEEGGVVARVDGGLFAEEYPTVPPSHVLNGGVFALWGVHDVAETLGDPEVRALHEELLGGLRGIASRYDLGTWSRYDLFPEPPVNVASSFYHHLHESQLRALHDLYGEPLFLQLADRLAAYDRRRDLRARAFVRKVRYRLLVPRPPIPFAKRKRAVRLENLLKVSAWRPIRRL